MAKWWFSRGLVRFLYPFAMRTARYLEAIAKIKLGKLKVDAA